MNNLQSSRGAISKSAPAVCLIALLAPIAGAQIPGAAPAHARAVLTSSGRATLDVNRLAPSGPAPSDLLREIDDPALGRRWMLYRDPRHPERPGRLVAIGAPSQPNTMRSPVAAAAPRPVIRAGDPVVLEEHSPIVDARLEAVALNPAFQGSVLQVRLVLGGKIFNAIAIAPGRVALAPQPGSQP